jgi:hypothetical protein
MLSYGSDVARFRLNVDHGIDGQTLWGMNTFSDIFRPEGDLRFYETTDEQQLAEIAAQVCEDLIPIVQFLETVTTPDGYLEWCAAKRRGVDLLRAQTAFGRTDDIESLLKSPSLRPHVESRELDLEYADAVMEAYELLGQRPSDHWRAFARKSVKAFRGRPPKHYRSMWEGVKTAGTSEAAPTGHLT